MSRAQFFSLGHVPLLIRLRSTFRRACVFGSGKRHEVGDPPLRDQGGAGQPARAEAVLLAQAHRRGGISLVPDQRLEHSAGV